MQGAFVAIALRHCSALLFGPQVLLSKTIHQVHHRDRLTGLVSVVALQVHGLLLCCTALARRDAILVNLLYAICTEQHAGDEHWNRTEAKQNDGALP